MDELISRADAVKMIEEKKVKYEEASTYIYNRITGFLSACNGWTDELTIPTGACMASELFKNYTMKDFEEVRTRVILKFIFDTC